MDDKELTKNLLKALDPNFLLKQEQVFIARDIESSAKSKAAADYIRKGINKVFRSSDTKKNKLIRTKQTRKGKNAAKTLFGRNNSRVINK